ncbi:MAG: M56 family metallopeptidase, partial [Gemmatimonadota bacterium]|nr:M56 family metallopeptidase [Gemmatimonadota bacterium]
MARHGFRPATSLVRREQAYRRLVLLGLAVLLPLSISPLFGHHLASGFDVYLAGRDHLWALCLVALHLILAPVHGLFHLLFFGGLGYAICDRARAWWTERRALGALQAAAPEPGDAFWEAAVAGGAEPRAVRVVDGLPSPAFTVGWLRPRLYVARELAGRLSPGELAAVLAHEGAHAVRRDPLRLSALRFLTCTLFWLPALRGLAEDVADEAEIQADDVAARTGPLALASAILALAQWARPRPAALGTVGFDER